jgi:hypothetical protein
VLASPRYPASGRHGRSRSAPRPTAIDAMSLRLPRPVLALALACVMTHAFAQDAAPEPASRTGSAWVDRQLDDINRYGARYRDAFVDELVRYHRAPRELVIDLLDRKWPPGDIYYACALGTVAGRPCRHVVDQYTHGEGPDWQAVAQRIGVEPDSVRYRRLKQGLVATYGRWGRPIEAERVPDPHEPRDREEPSTPPPAKAPASKLPIEPPPEGRRTKSASASAGVE